MAAGNLDAAVRKMVHGVGKPIRIVVQAYYCKDFGDGEFDPYDTSDDWDAAEFGAEDEGIEVNASRSRMPSAILKQAARAKSLVELGKAMASIPDHEWVWINLWLGHEFVLDPERHMRGDWTAAELYDRLLKPMRPWFR